MKRCWALLFPAFLAPLAVVWGQSPFSLLDVKPHLIQMHRARESGLLDSVEVKLGDKVKPGQVLARLEHDRQLHAYNVAKARAENLGSVMIAEGELQEKTAIFEDINMKFRRRQATAAQVAQSQGQMKAAHGRLEVARMNAELAKLELRLAEKMLERRFIRCGMDGTVIEIARAPGDRVGEGDVVVTVADLNWMTAFIPLTKESAAALTENATFPVRVAGGTATRIAQVIDVKPMPNGTKGEQLVQVAFANSDPLSLVPRAYEVLLPQNLKIAPMAKPSPAKPDGKKSSG
jgi:macrolide-specific efflux system membrane fusion protein